MIVNDNSQIVEEKKYKVGNISIVYPRTDQISLQRSSDLSKPLPYSIDVALTRENTSWIYEVKRFETEEEAQEAFNKHARDLECGGGIVRIVDSFHAEIDAEL